MPSRLPLLMVWLLVASALFAQAPASRAKSKAAPAKEQLYTLRGRILAIGTDLPVANALITFRSGLKYTPGDPDNFKNIQVFDVSTDNRGEFELELPVADYSYDIKVNDYALDEKASKEVKIVAGKKPAPLTIHMVRASRISGVVVDADGNGVPGVQVEAIETTRIIQSQQSATTGPNGIFSISSLLPGTYALLAAMSRNSAQNSSTAFVTTFYPGSADSFAAAEIAISGVDVPNIRIRMESAELHSVSGVVTGRELNPAAAQSVMLRPVEDYRLAVSQLWRTSRRRAKIESDGTFAFYNIPPGKYIVTVQNDRPPVGIVLATEAITVSDRDFEDLRMKVAPGGVFAGKFVVENGGKLPKSFDWTGLSGKTMAGDVSPSLLVQKDGSFSMNGLSDGTYVVMAAGAGSGYSVSSVEIGGQKFEGSRFQYTVPGSSEVVITLNAGGALLQGTLAGAHDPDHPVTGTATLVRLSGLTDGLRYARNATLTQNGSFTFLDLEAGKYLVCAWSDYSMRVGILLSSDKPPVERLQQLCKTVELKKDATESIEVRLTSFAEVTR